MGLGRIATMRSRGTIQERCTPMNAAAGNVCKPLENSKRRTVRLRAAGAMDVAGPVVVGGMLFTTSGYALHGATRGSVLLAFSIDGK